jgi:hypothetical protein
MPFSVLNIPELKFEDIFDKSGNPIDPASLAGNI